MTKPSLALTLALSLLGGISAAEAQNPEWPSDWSGEADPESGVSGDAEFDPEQGVVDEDTSDADATDAAENGATGEEDEALPSVAEAEGANADSTPLEIPPGVTDKADLLIIGGGALVGVSTLTAIILGIVLDDPAAMAYTLLGGMAVGLPVLAVGVIKRNDALKATDQRPDPVTGPFGLERGIALRLKMTY